MTKSPPQFIPLAAGVESDIAEKLVQPGSVTRLENGFSDFRGQVVRRGGSVQASTSTTGTLPDGGTLPNAWRLATPGGNLVRFNEAPVPLHAWAPEAAKWVRPTNSVDSPIRSYRKGPISTRAIPVFNQTPAGDQVSTPDVAYGGGYLIACYEHSSQLTAATTSQVAIIDVTTGEIVFERQLGVSTRRPRPFVVGGTAVVAYDNNGTFEIDAYDLTTLTLTQTQAFGLVTPGTPIGIRGGSVAGGINDFSVIYRNSTGVLTCTYADATALGTNATFEVQKTGGTAADADLAFGWMQDFGASGKFSVICAGSTDGLLTLWFLPPPTLGVSIANLTQVLDAGATAIPNGGTAGIRNVIGTTITSSSVGIYRVLYEVTAPNVPTQGTIKTAVWSGGVTLGTLYLGVGILSELWANDESFYFWSTFCGQDQSAYFALAMSHDQTVTALTFPAPQAAAFVRSGGGLTDRLSSPAQVAHDDSGNLITAMTSVSRVESVVSALTALGASVNVRAINLAALTHRRTPDTTLGKTENFLGSTFTPGGMLGVFDGFTYGTAGFAYYPRVFGSGTAAGGNLTPSAAYRHRACYSFIDRNGRKWRSSPSIPISTSTTGANFQISVKIETLRLYDRGQPSGKDGYQIELYRTDADEVDAYFLVGSFPNDPTAQSITITDNVADVNLGEELYTDGGGMENQLLPAISDVAQFQQRLFAAESGRGTLWYSLDIDLNHGLLFNETMTIDVGNPDDPITAILLANAGLIVWKKDTVYILFGEGANALGQGATYDVKEVGTGVGCVNPSSIVKAPDGSAWFKSTSIRAGFYRLNGLSLEYVGQGVRQYNDKLVTAAVVVPEQSQIRFYTAEGVTMCFNWNTPVTWGTSTVQPCLCAASGYVGSAGIVYAGAVDFDVMIEQERGAAFSEGPNGFTFKLRSPRLSLANMAGWESVCQIFGVGSPGGIHRVIINLYKDNSESPFQTLSRQFDGTETEWDWDVKPKIRQMSAFMIELEIVFDALARDIDVPPDMSTGGGANRWNIPGAEFTDADIGGNLTLALTAPNDIFNGAYAITGVLSDSLVSVTPDPQGIGSLVDPTAGTASIPAHATAPNAGPAISGFSLIVGIAPDLKRISAAKRAIST